jgi:DNA invertase Pin-like site-specific DNA recombinase
MKDTNYKYVACYVRVSTVDQEKGLDSQERALREYCANHGLTPVVWYKDRISGAADRRPAFDLLQKRVFEGRVHTICVWKLDRVSRKGLKDGVNILTGWLEKDIRVVSVTQQLDFSGQVGQMLAGILFALAAMERENLRENTRRGLAAAKARGVKLGKHARVFAKDITPLLEAGQTVMEAAERFAVTRQAIYMALRREGVSITHIRGKR